MSTATEFNDYVVFDETKYVLGSELMWYIGKKDSGWKLVIPAGFVFDITVPKLLRGLVSQHHRPWFLASAIHDYLMKSGFDRAFAAGEWYRAARAMKSVDDKKHLVYAAYLGIIFFTVKRRFGYV